MLLQTIVTRRRKALVEFFRAYYGKDWSARLLALGVPSRTYLRDKWAHDLGLRFDTDTQRRGTFERNPPDEITNVKVVSNNGTVGQAPELCQNGSVLGSLDLTPEKRDESLAKGLQSNDESVQHAKNDPPSTTHATPTLAGGGGRGGKKRPTFRSMLAARHKKLLREEIRLATKLHGWGPWEVG